MTRTIFDVISVLSMIALAFMVGERVQAAHMLQMMEESDELDDVFHQLGEIGG
jgi:hypothetical protein